MTVSVRNLAKRTLSPCLAALIVMAASCGGEPSGDGPVQERHDSAGVSVVVATPASTHLDWTPQEVWRVGGEDEGPTSFTRLGQWNVATDEDGSVYVLDMPAFRVVVLTSGGEVVRTFGGEGGGPGEFQMPAGMGVRGDGTVWVYDFGKRSMVRFGSDGSLLDERRLDFLAWGGAVRPAADGVFVEKYVPAGADTLSRSLHVVTEDTVGDLVSARFPRPAQVPVPGCSVRIPVGRLFEPALRWDGQGGRLVTHVGPEYVVDVYDGGTHTLSLRLDVPLTPVTEADAARQYPDGFRLGLPGGPCTADGAAMARAQGYASVLPAVSQLFVAPDGTVWVARGHFAGEEPPIDVWSAEGDFVGTLPPGTPIPVAVLPDGTHLVVETDELDVPYLVAVRWVEGGGPV